MMEISQIVTRARAIWFAVVLFCTGVGTGIGFLVGEGAARASFEGKWDDHQKRIVSVEAYVAASAVQNTQVIGMLGELKGEVRAVRFMLTKGEAGND